MKSHRTWGGQSGVMAWVLAACLSMGAQAAEPEVTEQVMTMRIKGQVGFDAQGKVIAQQFETPMSAQVSAYVQNAVAGWRAKPLLRNGQQVAFKSPIQMTLVGRETSPGQFSINVDRVVFKDPDAAATGAKSARDRRESIRRIIKPGYPRGLAQLGVGGIVLVALKFDEKGSVSDAAITQSLLLNAKGSQANMARARKALEDVCLRSARSVKVDPAALVPEPDQTVEEARIGVLPFNFNMPNNDNLGTWRIEQRGPKHRISFVPADRALIGASDLDRGAGLSGLSHSPVQLLEGNGAVL